ncbi:hypothetical protein NUSPORA_01322 [Nucleospora cyclopteri]
MLLQLRMQLEKDRHSLIRRATIFSVGKKIWTHLTLIVPYLLNNYNMNQQDLEFTKLKNAQKTNVYNKIKQKYLHSKLYKCGENKWVDLERTFIWFKKGNIKLWLKQPFASFKTETYSTCKNKLLFFTVDQLIYQSFDYTKTHNEIRSIHLLICLT